MLDNSVESLGPLSIERPIERICQSNGYCSTWVNAYVFLHVKKNEQLDDVQAFVYIETNEISTIF